MESKINRVSSNIDIFRIQNAGGLALAAMETVLRIYKIITDAKILQGNQGQPGIVFPAAAAKAGKLFGFFLFYCFTKLRIAVSASFENTAVANCIIKLLLSVIYRTFFTVSYM